MKILAFSDLHVDLDAAAELVAAAAGADLVIGAGDFASMHAGLERAVGALAGIETPTVLVPGNNETDAALRSVAAEWAAATVLHGEAAEIGGVSAFGLGAGIPTTPWDWSFDLTDHEAERALADAPRDLDVLILHSPPQGHVDRDGSGTSLGSPAILAAIERLQPKLAVCGHIHDSRAQRSRIGATEVANLGPSGAWFEL